MELGVCKKKEKRVCKGGRRESRKEKGGKRRKHLTSFLFSIRK